MEIRNFPAESVRIETGPIQFGDDWPGVFIRGDRAFGCGMELRQAIETGTVGPLGKLYLRDLLSLLASCIVGPSAEALQLNDGRDREAMPDAAADAARWLADNPTPLHGEQ